ncbi:copper amine oxidase [Halobacillus mangrovi]|uniref:copper amine oxidase n=1 Tax=Halobacillus mangrovi TaxID=402384 RepID=UPI003D960C12
MNFKKALLVVPMSASLLLPTSLDIVNAEDHKIPQTQTEAVELRSQLDNLFSEHAYLAVETMRKGAEGAADFQQAAAALSANTEDLTAAIESVYGEEAGKQFNEMWSSHIGYFVDYVKATGNEDEEAKKKALDELNQYRQDFSTFISDATGNRLKADALAEGLQMHVNQLIGAFDAYGAGDYEKAYMKEREAIEHMYGVSKGMSSAIVNQFPDKFNNTKAITPAADLRSNLNHLLSEHVGLATMAMQNGLDGSEDFEASAKALSNNTKDLTKAITSIFGEDAGTQFNDIWTQHIDDFVSYVKATANEDEAKQEEAMKALEDYRETFAKFLEEGTKGELSADKLTPSLQQHADYLFDTFDQYAAEDYEKTYMTLRDSYAHMFGASKALSTGIVAAYPDKFMSDKMPEEMPDTGMGGTASDNNIWLYASILAAIAATGIFLRRQPRKQ